MINTSNYYTDLFSVSIPQMENLLATALGHGGDYADLFFENTSYTDLLLRDGEVSSGGGHLDFGVGIRVLKGDKTGYAYSESTDSRSMTEAARTAAVIAQGGGSPVPAGIKEASVRQAEATLRKRGDYNGLIGSAPVRPFPGKPSKAADRYPMLKDWRDWDAENSVPLLHRLQDLISGKDSRVIKIMAMLSTSVSDILMFNSRGEMKYDTRPMGTLAVSVIFSDGKTVRNNHVSRSFRAGAEMLDESLLHILAEEAVRNLDDRFAAGRPKGGKMPVVMGAGASGILLHEAMGHAFEADFNRKGQSVFSDRMGERICRKGINIVDDATIKGNRGALNFDDEGVPGQRTAMVEDGILTSYLHDRISADFYGVPPTGNGRRESFRYNPIPRMRATYMEGGDAAPGDIIASVKKGIYVDEFANGQVKIGEGDFTFYVKSGYLIENGRLTMPVNDINIMGNGPQALADIEAVGNDAKVDEGAWTCGKEQSVPVSCGIPTVLVNNLTVGGE